MLYYVAATPHRDRLPGWFRKGRDEGDTALQCLREDLGFIVRRFAGTERVEVCVPRRPGVISEGMLVAAVLRGYRLYEGGPFPPDYRPKAVVIINAHGDAVPTWEEVARRCGARLSRQHAYYDCKCRECGLSYRLAIGTRAGFDGPADVYTLCPDCFGTLYTRKFPGINY